MLHSSSFGSFDDDEEEKDWDPDKYIWDDDELQKYNKRRVLYVKKISMVIVPEVLYNLRNVDKMMYLKIQLDILFQGDI